MLCLGRLMQLPRSHFSLPATPIESTGICLCPVLLHTVKGAQKGKKNKET